MTEDQAVQVPSPTPRRVKRGKDQPAANGPITSAEPFISVGDVARLYGVDPKTVTRWARDGRMPQDAYITTPGGHRKYREGVILSLINDQLR